jgi:hypothetical protein
MPLIEAALAFAITMLGLSLVVSSFVEIIHRIFSMREAGLKYMLGQMFDQVLEKYVVPAAVRTQTTNPALTQAQRNAAVQTINDMRAAFVARMSANRSPMGATPKATPSDPPEKVAGNTKWAFSLWSGRDLATMTPVEFMERLGSIDVGATVEAANTTANTAAAAAAALAGAAAADATDAVLKNVAQKFDALGKEAGAYFEGRARLLSVVVAIGLALAVHVDAVDLFRTYLRDPNARAKVIEQSQAVTAQFKAQQDAADAVKKMVPDANAAPADVKAQVEKLQQDWSAAITGANAKVKEYADLGVPLGWTDERIGAAVFKDWIWFCPAIRDDQAPRLWAPDCKQVERTVVLAVPSVPKILFYLLLGGLLIGLGSPFWYDVVTGLTSIRNAVKGGSAAAAPPAAAAAPPAPDAAKAQPVTAVGAFQISSAGRS